MTFSQLIHKSRQPIRGYSAPPPNWMDGWFWLSGWVSHGECTSAYSYTLDRPTVSHDLRLSSSHDLTKLLYCAIFQA